MDAYRDDRGVVVVSPANDDEVQSARAEAVSKLLEKHPGVVSVIVAHVAPRADAKARKRVDRLAERLENRLTKATGKGSKRVASLRVGASRARVHEPIPPPRPSRNERVEVILVPPTD
jgi:hypothetical protein